MWQAQVKGKLRLLRHQLKPASDLIMATVTCWNRNENVKREAKNLKPLKSCVTMTILKMCIYTSVQSFGVSKILFKEIFFSILVFTNDALNWSKVTAKTRIVTKKKSNFALSNFLFIKEYWGKSFQQKY